MDFEKRRKKVFKMREIGLTLNEIGKEFGISRQRVEQILSWKPKPKPFINPDLLPEMRLCFGCNRRNNTDRKVCLDCLPIYSDYLNLQGVDKIRELVRIRDRHTCQKCGKKQVLKRRFDVHHLDPEMESKKIYSYDKENMDKMITLCHKCHLNLHSVREKMLNAIRKYNKDIV